MISPKLSIITINYNNAAGLKKTIESVVSQTSKDFEYIIIDGGSTDGSLEIIKHFTNIPQGIYTPQHKAHSQSESRNTLTRKLDFQLQNMKLNQNTEFFENLLTDKEIQNTEQYCFFSPISFWVSEPDNGIYQAVNKGIHIAKGQYCQFLNSGDWLLNPNVTSLMLTNLPDSNIIYGNMLKQMSNGKILYNNEIYANSLLSYYYGSLNHSSAYIKHSLFDKYGYYDESLKIVSDWKFFLIAIILNNEQVNYRNIDICCFDMSGISNNNKELEHIERRKVLEELLPCNILADYDRYASFILKMKRINRYKFTRWLVWFVDRILFKTEKWETRIKGEHILY